jgi:Fe-S-cluster containining protein
MNLKVQDHTIEEVLADKSFTGGTTDVLVSMIEQHPGDRKAYAKYLLEAIYSIYKYLLPLVPDIRLAVAYSVIDRAVEQAKVEDPETWKQVPCKAGCSACCHINVSINSDEAKYLADKIRNGLVDIDYDRLNKQAATGVGHDSKRASNDTFNKLSYEDRACIFLGKDKKCRVYEDRPASCRKWHIVGDPEDCKKLDHFGGIAVAKRAEVVTSAMFNIGETGRLPAMIKRELDK